jgi:hypothetical protein
MSNNVDVKVAGWKQVEVGRVITVRTGPDAGKLATIVEIIDTGRVRIKFLKDEDWVDMFPRFWSMVPPQEKAPLSSVKRSPPALSH